MLPFNKPHLTGKETHYIYGAVDSLHLSGNGKYTKLCQKYFEDRYGFNKCLLTTSCTDALEMAAILIDTQPGDEIIVPSYTFVSTANAFVLRGAKIVFCDSEANSPNMDTDLLEGLITDKTKAIVPVHYAGAACDMDKIMKLANQHNLFVIEDAAQAIDSYYKGRALGSIGHFGTFSFHETKNIIAGEGGMLTINDESFNERAEIIWEKGTNRAAFHRGEVNKYGWVDIGSSFLPSEVVAAFLYAQLEDLEDIQAVRKGHWLRYEKNLQFMKEAGIKLPHFNDYATNNAHMFYLVAKTGEQREQILQHLKAREIHAVFHYLCLHKSPYFSESHDGRALPHAENYEDCLIRIPLFYDLKAEEIDHVINALREAIEIH